jgi:ribonucleoside-diphosphate reductase alpha chain
MIRLKERVRLFTPDNLVFHGAEATVEELTDWGAHVSTGAAATGRFRALWCEMRHLTETPMPDEIILSAVLREGAGKNGTATAREQARVEGFSGDVCPQCSSIKMIRAGVCLTCVDCGSTSGCG